MNYGGFIGGTLGFLLTKLIGQIGVIILVAAILLIYTTFFFAEKAGSVGQVAISIMEWFKKMVSQINEMRDEYNEKQKQLKEDREQHQREVSSQELMDDEFFKANGEAAEIKIKQLGIEENADTHGLSALVDPAKRIPEEEPAPVVAEPEAPRRRRADKPLDLSYGIEAEPDPVVEEPAVEEPKKQEYDKSFFGMDDSADNVFTKDFDPFDFATSEKASAKYASKVSTKSAVAEELDDMTLYEMKANHVPTEREKRRMELERKKNEWMNKHRPSAVSTPAPASTSSPAPAAPIVKEEPAPVAETVSTPTVSGNIPDSMPVSVPKAPVSSEVSTYSSYTSTKTSYSQPVKTVEFTITKTPKAAPTAPIESSSVNVTFDKTNHSEEAAEDVAILIAKRIAQSNPAYARSANDLKVYTKVVSNEDDELYRQLNGMSTETEEVIEAPSQDATEAETFEVNSPIQNAPDAVDASAQPEEVVEIESEPIAQPVEEASPVTVEFSVGEEGDNISVPTARSTYQRAAGFASALVNESVATPEAISFKPYSTPAASTEAMPSYEKEATLRVERTMLPPTAAAVNENAVEKVVDAPEIVVPEQETPVFQPVVVNQTNTPAEVDFTLENEIDFVPENDKISMAAEPTFTQIDETEEKVVEKAEESAPVISFDENENEDVDPLDEEEDGQGEPEEDVETEEIPPEQQNPEVIKMREMFPFLAPIGEQKPVSKPASDPQPELVVEDEEDVDDVPFDEPTQVKISSTSLVPAKEKKDEKKKKLYSDYKFPSLDFLAKQEESGDENIQAEIQENADKLIETLASFGVTASIKGVDRGPRITRYEVVPAKGVKVSSILNLQDDIALNLAAGSIRMEAPIPGKSAVGIEIPNKKSSIVRLRDLIETEEFDSNKSKTAVCIGRDVAGQPVFGDLAKMPHLLIAGATGMGKSVCINALLISVLYKARPDEVKFIMIDPKQVEFTMYNGIPHLLVPVVSDAKQAAGALMWAVEEMERRYNLLNSLCVRGIDPYNEKVTADPSLGEFLPKIVIVIDEFADLMLQVKDPVENLVTRIAQKARAAGIHLVIGTQRPSVNVITGVIKANVPSRISCKVMSNVDSKTVLDSAGAEKLLDKGDSLYAPAGSPKPHRLQCAFVADREVENIMNYLKQFSDGDSYDSSVMEDIERAAQRCSKKGGAGDRDDVDTSESGEGYLNDRQFLEAVEIAVNTRKYRDTCEHQIKILRQE